MEHSTFVFFLVVLQIAVVCCCWLWCKSHCGIAWIASTKKKLWFNLVFTSELFIVCSSRALPGCRSIKRGRHVESSWKWIRKSGVAPAPTSTTADFSRATTKLDGRASNAAELPELSHLPAGSGSSKSSLPASQLSSCHRIFHSALRVEAPRQNIASQGQSFPSRWNR